MQIQKNPQTKQHKNEWKNSHLHNKTIKLCWPSSPSHGACPRVWLMFSDTHLEKTGFPLPVGGQVQVTSCFGVGLHTHFPPEFCDLSWIEPKQGVCLLPLLLWRTHISVLLCWKTLRANFFHFFLLIYVCTLVWVQI